MSISVDEQAEQRELLDGPGADLLKQLIVAGSWLEAYEVLASSQHLSETRRLLAFMRQVAAEAADPDLVFDQPLQDLLDFLCECRDLGIESAVAGKLDCTGDELRALATSARPLWGLLAAAREARRAFEANKTTESLDHALACWRDALAHPALAGPFGPVPHWKPGAQVAIWDSAAEFLIRSFWRSQRSVADIDQALELWERAIAGTPSDDPARLAFMVNQGSALRTRYDATHDAASLNAALALFQQALEAAPEDWSGRPGALIDRATCVRYKFERTGDIRALEEAIALYREGVAGAPDDSFDRSRGCTSLGNALTLLYDRTGRAEHIEEAVAAHGRALQLLDPDSFEWALCAVNLAVGLMKRHEPGRSVQDLDLAITLLRQSLARLPHGSQRWIEAVSNLGLAQRMRFQHSREPDDLKEAVALARRALETVTDAMQRDGLLSNLGLILDTYYQHTGDIRALEEAIAVTREGLALGSVRIEDQRDRLSSLGKYLNARFHLLGQMDDLQEAIQAFERATPMTTRHTPTWAGDRNNLATNLRTRFDHLGNIEDLANAIAAFRQALDATPRSAPKRGMIRSNLAAALRRRHHHTNDMADLDEATAIFRQLLEEEPEDWPERPMALANMANCEASRYMLDRQLPGLQRAIARYREVIAVTAAPHSRLMLRHNQCRYLGMQYDHTQSDEHGLAAVEAFRQLQRLERAVQSSEERPDDEVTVQANCEKCGPTSARLPLIIDLANIDQHPDRERALQDNEIHNVHCSSCADELGTVDAPLLLHCPEPRSTLVFSPQQNTSAERDKQVAEQLVQRWDSRPGAHAIDESQPIVWLPRQLVSLVVEQGLPAALEKLAEARQQADESPSIPFDALMEKLLVTESWLECYAIVHEIRELLADETLVQMSRQATQAKEAEFTNLVQRYEELIQVLVRCRQQGIESAFAEKIGCSPDELAHEYIAPRALQLATIAAEHHGSRHERTLNRSDLERSIEYWQDALAHPALADAPSDRRTDIWTSAAMAFIQRGLRDDVTRAKTLLSDMLALTDEDDPERMMLLCNTGIAWRRQYGHTGDVNALNESIALSRQALAGPGGGQSDRLLVSYNLGCSLIKRFTATSALDDLHEAVSLFRQVAGHTSTASSRWPHFCLELGEGLLFLHEETGEFSALQEAIACHQAVFDTLDESSTHRRAHMHRLGRCLATRHDLTGDEADLERAISLFQTGVDTTPDASARSTALGSLASGLMARYRRTGRIDDLHAAVSASRRSVAAEPDVANLTNLGGHLKSLYDRTGRLEDLHDAIAIQRRAAASALTNSRVWPGVANNLALALIASYRRTGDMTELGEAVELFREAVARTNASSLDYAKYLNNLAFALNTRYSETSQPDDLQEALSVGRRSVAACEGRSVVPGGYLSNLAHSLMHEYRRTGDVDTLNESIALEQGVLDATPEAAPDRPRRLYNLALGIRRRYEETRTPDDLAYAIALAREAAQAGAVIAPSVALNSAHQAARWSLVAQAWYDAADDYRTALQLVNEQYQQQVLRAGKHNALRGMNTLYVEAAYCLARCGDLAGAVLALETGRARTLSDTLDRNRAAFEQVEKQAPDTIRGYREALARLAEMENKPGDEVSGRPMSDLIRDARAQVNAAVEAIRELPGQDRFLSLPTLDDLAEALAPDVPVLYMSATSVGGLALQVSMGQSGLELQALWLDGLSSRAVDRLLGGHPDDEDSGWLPAYRHWQRQPHDPEARARWRATIDRTAGALWNVAVGPVVDHLVHAGVRQAVLIPSGLLALLPLHAAWGETDPTDGTAPGRRWALDDVVFSYAPSLRAFGHARTTAERYLDSEASMSLLSVAAPTPTITTPLPNSSSEAETVASYFAAECTTALMGEQCARESVLAAIERADVCHFSCHGSNDWREPLRSGILVSGDEEIAVSDLFALPDRRARLAVLSACETGIVGLNVPDEVIALPAAFMQSGFAAVVASLWSVYDLSTALLISRFFEQWRRRGDSVPVALREAQRWLRTMTNRELVEHLEAMVPALVPRMSLEQAEELHFRALVRRPDERPFATPDHWAAFYITGF